jgi:putative transcriptional regulator
VVPLPITNTIRRLRFEHGEMTQQDLAERVGVTRQTINAIELGKYSPSSRWHFRIAAAFRPGSRTCSRTTVRRTRGRPAMRRSPATGPRPRRALRL